MLPTHHITKPVLTGRDWQTNACFLTFPTPDDLDPRDAWSIPGRQQGLGKPTGRAHQLRQLHTQKPRPAGPSAQ